VPGVAGLHRSFTSLNFTFLLPICHKTPARLPSLLRGLRAHFLIIILALVLKQISQVILQDKKFVIHWYYEQDDEDIFDRGKYIAESLHLPVGFIVIDDIKNR